MAWHDDYTYDEPNVEAKLNCLAGYVYNNSTDVRC